MLLVKNSNIKPVQTEIRSLYNQIRVVIQDYNDSFLEGFARVLSYSGFNIVGKVSNKQQLMKTLYKDKCVDVIIINYKKTQPKTLNLVRWLKWKYPSMKVIIHTQYTTSMLIKEVQQMGIEGIMLKSIDDLSQIKLKILAAYYGQKCVFS